MEQNKNKEAGFGGRQTENEETQSAREAARWKREAALERARRKEDICEAYDALCRCLDERKIMLDAVKAIELRHEDGEQCLEDEASVFYRIADSNEREFLYFSILTGMFVPNEI